MSTNLCRSTSFAKEPISKSEQEDLILDISSVKILIDRKRFKSFENE